MSLTDDKNRTERWTDLEKKSTHSNIEINSLHELPVSSSPTESHPLISVKHCARFLHPSLQWGKAAAINHSEDLSESSCGDHPNLCEEWRQANLCGHLQFS